MPIASRGTIGLRVSQQGLFMNMEGCQMMFYLLQLNLHGIYTLMGLQPQVFLEAEVVYVQALAQQL